MLNKFDIQRFSSNIDGSTAPYGLLSRADKDIIDNLGKTYLSLDAYKLDKNISNFAICSTDSATVNKTVTISSITTLATGTRICIKFSNTNTADNATLQVNSLTAAPIMYRGYNIVSGALTANSIYDMIYTGSAWELITPITWVEE